MADIPDLDLSTLTQPSGAPTAPPDNAGSAQPVREVVAPLHGFNDPLLQKAAEATPASAPVAPATAPVATVTPAVMTSTGMLYAPAGSQTAPPNMVPVAEETIQIVPNPTTNRFPWTPVENPKVQIMQPVAPAPQPAPPAEVQPTPVVAVPAPMPEKEVEPLPIPELEPEPAVVPQPPLPVEPPTLPSPPPPAPLPPEPAPAPEPVLAPAPEPAPVPPPVEPPVPPPAQAAPSSDAETQAKAVEAYLLPPDPHTGKRPVHVYSEHTREVWRVFRPSTFIKTMLIGGMMMIIGGAIVFWLMSGAPTDVTKLPILESILKSE